MLKSNSLERADMSTRQLVKFKNVLIKEEEWVEIYLKRAREKERKKKEN